MRHTSRKIPPPRRIIYSLFLLVQIRNIQFVEPADPSSENFCGTDWIDAFENCHEPCPTGQDSECSAPEHSCHGYTGCVSDNGGGSGGTSNTNGGGNNSGNGNSNTGGISIEGGSDDPYKNNMCGSTWLMAMLSCSKPCPPGTSCSDGETCFAATNCDKPMEPILSKMIMSLLGDYPGGGGVNLGRVEQGVFSESVLEFLAAKLEENKVAINGADVTGQSFAEGGGNGRRRLMYWNDTVTGTSMEVKLTLEQRRRLPSGSSALDVSMTITGEYRPPPYQDVGLIIEDSINRASQNLVTEFRTRGSRGGTRFFEDVNGMSAVRVEAATPRPTEKPTEYPTARPTRSPTLKPTADPTTSPTTSPSTSPTRAFDQILQSGYGPDLYEGTARSFGNLFEIRTKPKAETVLIQGLEFYSAADANTRIKYEVWTKEGTWEGFEGKLDSFTQIAAGSTRSRGTCDATNADRCNFSRIPFDKFTNVAILGGGGIRSFYITLTTKEMMYKRGESTGMTDFVVQMDTPDIEIYEGAGVLVYPLSEATDDSHYRKPRGFLGKIYYQRNPCEDGSQEWPCQTRSPVSSFQLSSAKPTRRPTPNPTSKPTPSPTEPWDGPEPTPSPSPWPSPAPQTEAPVAMVADMAAAESVEAPTFPVSNSTVATNDEANIAPRPAPVAYDDGKVLATNLVVRLQDVEKELMNEREMRKYEEILTDFLRSDTSLQAASVDVINVTIWHQKIFEVVIEKTTSKSTTPKRGKARKMLANKAPRGLQGDSDTNEALVIGIEDEASDIEAFSPTAKVEIKGDIDVTTIITTANSIFPADVTNTLLLHVVKESTDLIDRFHAERMFFSYFTHISDIKGAIIEVVTPPPTVAPSTWSAANIMIETAGEEGENDEGSNIIVMVGIAIGALWLLLTLCGMCHLAKARGQMQDEIMLRKNTTSTRPSHRTTIMEQDMKKSFLQSYNANGSVSSSGESGTKLTDDFAESGTIFYDEEEGTPTSQSSRSITVNDLFPSTPSGAPSQQQQRKKRNGTFQDRLNSKLSSVQEGGSQGGGGSQQPSRQNFNDRLKSKLSESTTVSSKGNPSFNDRLKSKLSESTTASSKGNPSFNDRLKSKLSESTTASSQGNPSFNDRLKLKMSTAAVKCERNEEDSEEDRTNASSFDDLLQHKMSVKNKKNRRGSGAVYESDEDGTIESACTKNTKKTIESSISKNTKKSMTSSKGKRNKRRPEVGGEYEDDGTIESVSTKNTKKTLESSSSKKKTKARRARSRRNSDERRDSFVSLMSSDSSSDSDSSSSASRNKRQMPKRGNKTPTKERLGRPMPPKANSSDRNIRRSNSGLVPKSKHSSMTVPKSKHASSMIVPTSKHSSSTIRKERRPNQSSGYRASTTNTRSNRPASKTKAELATPNIEMLFA